jgi:hypothetical protein
VAESHYADTALRIQLLAWAGVGAVVGLFVGSMVAPIAGISGFGAASIGAVIGAIAVYVGGSIFSHGAAAVARVMLEPSGSSTPDRPEFSLAESLVVRGRLREAADEYLAATMARPKDPEPCIRLARLYRDGMGRPTEAMIWFERACERASGTQVEQSATRELVDLLCHRLEAPRRALPVLARQAERHAGTAFGEWARRVHAEIKDREFSTGTHVAVHTDREEAIRISSGRVATRREPRAYEEEP